MLPTENSYSIFTAWCYAALGQVLAGLGRLGGYGRALEDCRPNSNHALTSFSATDYLKELYDFSNAVYHRDIVISNGVFVHDVLVEWGAAPPWRGGPAKNYHFFIFLF